MILRIWFFSKHSACIAGAQANCSHPFFGMNIPIFGMNIPILGARCNLAGSDRSFKCYIAEASGIPTAQSIKIDCPQVPRGAVPP